ncbi:type II/IV secretion system ATPase subunit [Methanofollis fontis]|uniref:Secretion system protein E n=1 Tax=Methanofollis fontis TaxID=2052832 RepID=A0A483CRN5_9EURY|nr:type II/IV secretion system ATPase subunit [Methanofollis fontis]TAJ45783.1 secretion system protein E [Methanofollis fontis]
MNLPFPGKKTEQHRVFEEYNPETEPSLVDAEIPDDFDLIDEYWVEQGRSLVRILRDRRTGQNEYHLIEPALSAFEYELLERMYEDLRDTLILSDDEMKQQRRSVLLDRMDAQIREYGIVLDTMARRKVEYYILRNFLGWSRLHGLMKDTNIEDISCDGSDIPIFLYHRYHKNIRTNIRFSEEELNSLGISLAQRSGKHVSIGTPVVDATLPDGSRLQLTFGKEVSTRGTSFTIRKFRAEPFTPVELLDLGTFSSEELAYFWMAIENNKSLLFIGGTASGKTTSLNAVSLFIPPLAKVVSIEDTREITLFHENWVASVTRDTVAGETSTSISMFDLLKAAMRQRPEFILVGEVRGEEAQTLFQAMNTGHTTFSTMHAGSVDAAIHRLENEPLNVPRNMVQALDIVSIQALTYRGTERVRRCQEIVEIVGVDPGTGNLQVNTVFSYDPVSDEMRYSGRSLVYGRIMELRGWTAAQLADEIQERIRILEAMKAQGITDYRDVSRIFHAYAINRDSVMDALESLSGLFL